MLCFISTYFLLQLSQILCFLGCLTACLSLLYPNTVSRCTCHFPYPPNSSQILLWLSIPVFFSYSQTEYPFLAHMRITLWSVSIALFFCARPAVSRFSSSSDSGHVWMDTWEDMWMDGWIFILFKPLYKQSYKNMQNLNQTTLSPF